MSHHIVNIEGVQIGDLIKVKRLDTWTRVEEIKPYNFICATPDMRHGGPRLDSSTKSGMNERLRIIQKEDYEYTEKYSSDCTQSSEDWDAWSDCEIYYGISHLGSQDPDPVRQLAFRILKGDPQAIDIALDVIARGV